MRFPCVPLIAAAVLCGGLFTVASGQEGQPAAAPAKSKKKQTPDPFFTPRFPDGYPADDFHVRAEVFAVPLDAARRALRQFPKQADLYAWLEAEMEKPAPVVKLERMDVIRVGNGRRARLAGIDEYPYPSQLDSARMPGTIAIGPQAAPAAPVAPQANKNTHPDTTGGKDLPPAFPESGPAGSIPAGRIVPPWPYRPVTPTGFSVRNTGWTMEVDLTVSDDGKDADIRTSLEFVRPAGWEAMTLNEEIEKALFENRQFRNAEMRTPLGKPVFAGTFNRAASTGAGGAGQEDATRLLFFTVTPTRELYVPKPAPETAAAPPPLDPLADPGPAGRHQIEGLIRCDAISLPPGAARKALRTHPKAAELYSWLDSEQSRKDSGVSLEHTSTLRVLEGQRAKSEPVMQFPYISEITASSIPQNITLPPYGSSTPIPGMDSLFSPWPFVPTITSGTATRNLGWTIELEFNLGDNDGLPELNLTAENVRVAGKPRFGANKDVWMPVFETQQFTGQVELSFGQPALVGTFTPPTGTGIPGANTSDRVWFLFTTATIAE